MAWTSMHFAAGMAGAGAACLAWNAIRRRPPRGLTLAMTVGGAWAITPDIPRLFREDFPSLGLAESLGAKSLERRLHEIGDLFFGHAALDAQPHEFALAGLFFIVLLYNAAAIARVLAEWIRAESERGDRSAGQGRERVPRWIEHARFESSDAPTSPAGIARGRHADDPAR